MPPLLAPIPLALFFAYYEFETTDDFNLVAYGFDSESIPALDDLYTPNLESEAITGFCFSSLIPISFF